MRFRVHSKPVFPFHAPVLFLLVWRPCIFILSIFNRSPPNHLSARHTGRNPSNTCPTDFNTLTYPLTSLLAHRRPYLGGIREHRLQPKYSGRGRVGSSQDTHSQRVAPLDLYKRARRKANKQGTPSVSWASLPSSCHTLLSPYPAFLYN